MTTKGLSFSWSKNHLPKLLFINNEYVESKNGNKSELRNPADGSLVADDVPIAGEAEVDAAVAAAEAAFPAWKKMLPSSRRDILNKFADLLQENGDALAELSRLTLGAPRVAMGDMETDKFAGESYSQEDGFMKIVRNEPLGVTAGIIPWNIPLQSAATKAVPALAMGNCFILKPSEKTPFAALALGTLIQQAGFPPGVFQVIPGDGSTGALLASHMRVRKVSFTGSTGVGRRIQEMAARSNLKRVSLELGGKSPAVVFSDCDLDNAVAWCANSITINSGQGCVAASRVYVQASIYDRFVAGYKKALEEKSAGVGDPNLDSTVMGPLVDKVQFDRVRGFVERGRRQGQGSLLVGGNQVKEEGYFVPPTVFENVAEDAEMCREEIFGPVAVLNKFGTEEEIIAKANDSNFGLMAGVFTQDINKAMRVASELDSGMVGINCISLLFVMTPFGGTKESGTGRENAIHALRLYTEPKTVMVNLTY